MNEIERQVNEHTSEIHELLTNNPELLNIAKTILNKPDNSGLEIWIVKIYRRDSVTPITIRAVKHTWYENNGRILVISQYTTPPVHRYIHYPMDIISHVVVERE